MAVAGPDRSGSAAGLPVPSMTTRVGCRRCVVCEGCAAGDAANRPAANRPAAMNTDAGQITEDLILLT
jgi:hypothetical protein